MNNEQQMVIIESRDENGVEWGLSVDGPNPTAEQFVKCVDREHAIRVKRFFDNGILGPWLEAAGASSPDLAERLDTLRKRYERFGEDLSDYSTWNR